MSTLLNNIRAFLQDFKTKLKIWDVIFRDDRGKNAQTLLNLDITPVYRRTILEGLEPPDYSSGPLQEKLNGGPDLWVFGVTVKGTEVYIKISLGMQNAPVICISFHIAEHPMKYPLK